MSVWRSYPSKLQLNEYVLIGVDVLLHFGIMWCLHELGLNVAQLSRVEDIHCFFLLETMWHGIKSLRFPLFLFKITGM